MEELVEVAKAHMKLQNEVELEVGLFKHEEGGSEQGREAGRRSRGRPRMHLRLHF